MRFEILRIDSHSQKAVTILVMTVKELKAALQGVPDTYELDIPLEFKVEKKMVTVVIQGVPAAKIWRYGKGSQKSRRPPLKQTFLGGC